MKKIALCISLLIFASGYSNSVRAQDDDIIDYKKLDELEVVLSVNIKESKDYFPGKLEDLVLMSDGTMIVSDLAKGTIEQFSPEGEHKGTVASSGNGPGELPSLFSLLRGGNDTLMVRHGGMSGQIDYFAGGSGHMYTHMRSMIKKPSNEQRLDLIGNYTGRKYFAFTGLPDVALIKADLPDYRRNPIAILDESLHILRDSLHMLKTPNYIFADPTEFSTRITMKGFAYLGMPPYRYRDRLLPAKDGHYMIARPDSAAFFFYNKDHQLYKKIPLRIKERPVEQTDLEFAFKNHSMGGKPRIRNELEDHVSGFKPPFLNVWISEKHILLHTDTGEQGKQMVVLTKAGQPLGKFRLPIHHDIKAFSNDKIYSIDKDPGTGHSIRVYKVAVSFPN